MKHVLSLLLALGISCSASADDYAVMAHGGECVPLDEVDGRDGQLSHLKGLDDLVARLKAAGGEVRVVDGREMVRESLKDLPPEKRGGVSLPNRGDVIFVSAKDNVSMTLVRKSRCKEWAHLH